METASTAADSCARGARSKRLHARRGARGVARCPAGAPHVSADIRGEIRWAAEPPRMAAASGSKAGESSQLALWSLDLAGEVNARRGTTGSLRQMAAGPGALYLSDQRVLRKLTQ